MEKRIGERPLKAPMAQCALKMEYQPYISKEYRLLKFYCVPATSTTSSKALSLFAAAIYSTNEANKAGGTCH
jgi:hypothetical protein